MRYLHIILALWAFVGVVAGVGRFVVVGGWRPLVGALIMLVLFVLVHPVERS